MSPNSHMKKAYCYVGARWKKYFRVCLDFYVLGIYFFISFRYILFSSFFKENNFPKVSNSIFLIREREALQQQQQQQQLNIFEDDASWTTQSQQQLLQRQQHLFPLLKQQQQTEQQVQQTGAR